MSEFDMTLTDSEVYDDNDSMPEGAGDNSDGILGLPEDDGADDIPEEIDDIKEGEAEEDTDDPEEDDEGEETDEEVADDEDKPFAGSSRQADAMGALLAQKGIDYNGLINEFNSNSGRLTAETIAKLEKAGYPEEVVKGYIAGQQAIYDRYQESVKKTVGGEKNYARLINWATNNLSRQEKLAFNSAVESGDISKARFVLKGLQAQYEKQEGRAAKLVKGTASKTSSKLKGFTMDEYFKATDDPRYEKDREYTKKVNERLLLTDFSQS